MHSNKESLGKNVIIIHPVRTAMLPKVFVRRVTAIFWVYTYNSDFPGYHGSYDILIVSIDTVGNVLWEKCYGGSTRDYVQKIIAAGNDEYYVLGKTKSSDGDVQSGNHGGYDFWVFKINGTGELLWEKTFGTPDFDTPRDFLALPGGGLLLAGEVKSNGGDVSENFGDWDIWLCRLDVQNSIVWEKTLGNAGEDRISKLMMNDNGNIMLAGTINKQGGSVTCTPKGFADIWLAEVDINGQIISNRCYGGGRDDLGYSITPLEDGYVILATSCSGNGDVSGHHYIWTCSNCPDIWVCKIDTAFNIVWQKSLGGGYQDMPAAVQVNEENELTVFGYTYSKTGDVSDNHSDTIISYTSDILVVKFGTEGDIVWEKCFGGIGNEIFTGKNTVIQSGVHSYIMAAQSDYSISCDVQCGSFYDSKNVWLVEIQECPGYFPETPGIPSGPDSLCSTIHLQSTYSITPPAHAWTFEWEITPEDAGVITGQGLTAVVEWNQEFEGTASIRVRSANYCTESQWSEPKNTQVHACPGIEETNSGNVLRVYPNPAGNFVKFTTQLFSGGSEPFMIQIFDIYGRQAASLQFNNSETVWNCSKVPRGLYFYTVKLNGSVISGKVVVSR